MIRKECPTCIVPSYLLFFAMAVSGGFEGLLHCISCGGEMWGNMEAVLNVVEWNIVSFKRDGM